MKKVKKLFLIAALLIMAAVLYLMFSGPRMRNQPSIRTYQAAMPTPSLDSVSFNFPQKVTEQKNPLPLTEHNLTIGKTAYGYYCLFCHGISGAGDGPVGQSYDPVPTDLRSQKIQAFSDSQLYNAMLTGTGHQPVLPQIIDQKYRWFIALYVRTLKEAK